MPFSETIVSPCVKSCRLDGAGRACLSCERTVEEIGAWAVIGAAERERIMAELPGRRRARLARER